MHKLKSLAAVLATVGLLNARPSPASDTPVKPAPTTAGPAIMPGVGCSSCAAAQSTFGHVCGKPACGTAWFGQHKNKPYVVNLCPGACFGYFQTQWRKWEDVCPYPYLGIGMSDAPNPPMPKLKTPSEKLPTPGGKLPEPRPSEPQKMVPGTSLPPIPIPPG
jgi:hypothetical protein